MARAIDKRIMLDLIIEAKKTDPETGPFSEWLAEYLVDHLPTLTPPNEWVSVEDRMPEDENDGETVLVIVFGKPHENITLHGVIMTAGYFRDEGWVLNEYPEWEGPEVTHWMPLPSPPAELEKRLRGVRA